MWESARAWGEKELGIRRWFLGGFVLAIAMVAGPQAAPAEAAVRGTLRDATITVGSFDFPESELLAEIYAQALEANRIRVRREFRVGPREVVFPALVRGLVELVPEYAGTALRFVSLGADAGHPDLAATHRQLIEALAPRRATALSSAPAVDANAFVVTRATADRYALDSLSDLAPIAQQLTFGGPPECPRRPFCLLGLERVYDLRFDEVVALDTGGPLTKQALRTGVVDVALLLSTDPDLEGDALVELVDDRSLQPAENVTPVIRNEALAGVGPSARTTLDAVSAQLTTESLRSLNAELLSGESTRSVARGWLRARSLA
jgi:osmoprotectant transport system substrate-binding protein